MSEGDSEYWQDKLRWHWGEAYVIWHEGFLWLAQRRDDRSILRAEGPWELREAIVADYAERPVPRGDY